MLLGWNLFTELRHETKHGIQFEHGKIGFKFNEKTSNFAPLFYDVYDELEASIAGAGTFSWVTPTQRSEFQSKSRDEKMSLIKKTYPEIEQDFNLHNPGRGRKDSEYFMLPYKPQ